VCPRIMSLTLDASLILEMDSRLHGKEVNPSTTSKGVGVILWIPFLTDVGSISFYLLVRQNLHVYMCMLL